METSILKLILDKSDLLIITIFICYLAYNITVQILNNKKAKSSQDLIKEQYLNIQTAILSLSELAKNLDTKDKIIDSIERKLKIIYNQWGSDLSKEAAISVIQNIYYSYASIISNEVYELQKKSYSINTINKQITNTLTIVNDEKMQELDLFMYRNKVLVTYTNGMIVEPEKVISVINSYSEKNGLLRKEIEGLMSLEAIKIINRL